MKGTPEYRAYQAKWRRERRAKDPEGVRAQARKRYAEKREAILADVKTYQAKNTEKIRAGKRAKYASWEPASRRDRALRSRYGIGHDDYLAMYDQQRGRCAVCGEFHPLLVVDHSHANGLVRGLLCARCNLGLGLLGDDTRVLASAATYLERN